MANDLNEQRLHVLARQVARWKSIGVVLAVVGGGIILVGFFRPEEKVLKAEKFVLIDQGGVERATLDIGRESGQPGLCLYGEDGKSKLILTMSKKHGPTILLVDSKGVPRSSFSIVNQGESSALMFMGANGRPLGGVRERDGQMCIQVLDPNGSIDEQWPMPLDGSVMRAGVVRTWSLEILGKGDVVRAEAKAGADGNMVFSLNDGKGLPRAKVTVQEDGRATLEFIGDGGIPRLRIPE